VAAIKMFSVAALQSCTQAARAAELLAMEASPHTTIAAGAL
jgi:hypothetical protein